MNWTAYRDTFEREASAYIGRPVAVSGKASVRLLPTPVLSFTNIRIGEAADPDVEIERFRAEVELAPLLKGEVRIIQMTVERPRWRVDVASWSDGATRAGERRWRIDPERVSLARLEVVEGTAVISDSRAGRSFLAENVNGVVEAGSLTGPGRIEAKLSLDGRPVVVRAGLGRLAADNTLPVKVSVSSPLFPLTLMLDGDLAAAADAPKFEGSVTLAGPVPGDGAEARPALADVGAQGAILLTPHALSLDKVQVSYGGTERPLVVQTTGQIDFGGNPRFDLTIGARQVELDRVLPAGTDRPATIAEASSRVLRMLPDLPLPPIPGDLHIATQGAVIAGSVIQDVGIELSTGPDGWRLSSMAAVLPGETHVEFSGDVQTTDPPSFKGRGRIASARPAALAAWWNADVGSSGALDSFAIEADVDFDSTGQKLTNLVASTGGGTVKGAIELRLLSGARFVTVDLSSDRADLVEARALGELFARQFISGQPVDQMTLTLRADVLSAGGVDARDVVVEGSLADGSLQLRNVSIADLAGASIEARGSIADPFGKPAGSIDATLAAADITGAADFLGSLFPDNVAVAHFRSVAPTLSPAQAEISAEAGTGEGPIALDLTGSFGETHVTISGTGTGSVGSPESLSGSLKAHLDGAETSRVLTQLGLEPVPIRAGPFQLDAEFSGALASAGKLNVSGRVAGIELSYAAETSVHEGNIAVGGDFRATSPDADQALLLAGVALPGIGEGHDLAAAGRLERLGERGLRFSLSDASFNGQKVAGALAADFRERVSLAGELQLPAVSLPLLASLGAGSVPEMAEEGWTDAAFAPPLPKSLALRLAVDAGQLDLGLPYPAANARLNVAFSDGQLNIDLAESDFGGGALKGALAASVGEGEAEASIRAAIQGGELQALVWEHGGLPIASGLIDASFDVTGRGRSMAGLVSTLTGSGSFSISAGRINALNPEALDAVLQTPGPDQEPDDNVARETFASRFGSGALSFGRAAGSFSVSGGVVSLAKVSLEAQGTEVLADATIDLNSLTLGSEWAIRSVGEEGEEAETPAAVGIRFSGPLMAPERSVDLGPLLELLHSRYLQRQLDELEGLEEARRRADARSRGEELEEEPPPQEAPASSDAGSEPSTEPTAAIEAAAPPLPEAESPLAGELPAAQSPAAPAQPARAPLPGAAEPVAGEPFPAPAAPPAGELPDAPAKPVVAEPPAGPGEPRATETLVSPPASLGGEAPGPPPVLPQGEAPALPAATDADPAEPAPKPAAPLRRRASGTPSRPPAEENVPAAPPLQLVPEQGAAASGARRRNPAEILGSAIQTIVTGQKPAPPAAATAGAAPASPAEAASPASQQTASPPARTRPDAARAVAPATRTRTARPAPADSAPEGYRTLPNGVVVKIR